MQKKRDLKWLWISVLIIWITGLSLGGWGLFAGKENLASIGTIIIISDILIGITLFSKLYKATLKMTRALITSVQDDFEGGTNRRIVDFDLKFNNWSSCQGLETKGVINGDVSFNIFSTEMGDLKRQLRSKGYEPDKIKGIDIWMLNSEVMKFLEK